MGKCCSHVASLLWAVEAGVRIRDSVTVTQKKAYWVMPHSVKDVPYSPVNKIEFLGKKRSLTSFQTLQYESGSSTSTSPCISIPLLDHLNLDCTRVDRCGHHLKIPKNFLLHWLLAANQDLESCL